MSLAFFCLGAASLGSLRGGEARGSNKAGTLWDLGVLIIGVAYFCGGIFPPDPKWFVGSLLHGIGGLIVIFGSPIVFTLMSKSLVRNEASATAVRRLVWTATLTWLSLLLFYGSIIAFRGGVVVGWTNRILIATFVLWLLVAAFEVRNRSR